MKDRIDSINKLVDDLIEKYNNDILSDEIFTKIVNNFNENLRLAINSTSKEKYDELLDANLEKAYAFATYAIYRKTGKRLRDVQLMGSLKMNDGNIIEMKTGEGKTLTAVLPAYLNALSKRGVHVATTNEYLSERDYLETKDIYTMLSLTSSHVEEGISKDKEKKKEAYSQDIVYGSINTLAFDKMYDDVKFEEEDLVNKRNPNFLIIDEADDIMIDTAVTPFIISDYHYGDKVLYGEEFLEEEKLEKNQRMRNDALYINLCVLNLFDEIKNNDNSMMFLTKSKEEFDYLTLGKIGVLNTNKVFKERKYILDNSFIIVNPSTGEYDLTENGYRILSYPLLKQKLEDNNSVMDYFINNLKEGKDYRLEDGKFKISLLGYTNYLKNTKNEKIKEIANNIELEKCSKMLKTLNNSLTAYFMLEQNKDYIIDNTEDKNIKKISLIINGRKAIGKTYSDGLQLAVELKEQSLMKYRKVKGITIKETLDNPTLTKLTMASFLEKYKRVSGMTGTSPENAFDLIYNLETFKVPTNREYLENITHKTYPKRTDETSLVFYSDQEKYEYLRNEVLKIHQTGQPILLSTTSIEESEKLYQELIKVLKEDEIEVLNANTDEEAKIIANAGRLGKITISTEMAGRGTDIKLGSDINDYIELKILEKYKLEEKKYLEIARKHLESKGINDFDTFKQNFYKKAFKSKYEEKIRKEVLNEDYEEVKKELEEERELVKKIGGLKLIAVSHFKSERIDNQVKGRVARGMDPGVSKFISSLSDLENIGVILNKNEIEELKEKRVIDEDRISDKIKKVQSIKDNSKFTSIYYENQEERQMGIIRKITEDAHKYLRTEKDFTEILARKIKESISFIKNEKDEEKLRQIEEDLGIKVTTNEKKMYSDIVEKIEYLKDMMGEDNFNNKIRTILMQSNISMWDEFRDRADIIRKHNNIIAFSFRSEDEKNNNLIKSFYDTYNDLAKRYQYNSMCLILKDKNSKYLEEGEYSGKKPK